jgi:hypothetical protein
MKRGTIMNEVYTTCTVLCSKQFFKYLQLSWQQAENLAYTPNFESLPQNLKSSLFCFGVRPMELFLQVSLIDGRFMAIKTCVPVMTVTKNFQVSTNSSNLKEGRRAYDPRPSVS